MWYVRERESISKEGGGDFFLTKEKNYYDKKNTRKRREKYIMKEQREVEKERTPHRTPSGRNDTGKKINEKKKYCQ